MRPLQVMLSSRCRTVLRDGTILTDLRRAVKAAIEGQWQRDGGERRVAVWINEDSAARPGSASWYEESRDQVEQADIVVVLFSGDAGSKPRGQAHGVCHAELAAALADAPTKVRAVDVRGLIDEPDRPSGTPHDEFVEMFDALNLMTRQPSSATDAVADAVDAVASAICELALGGIATARRGSKSLGAALDWRRLTFAERKGAMEEALVHALERQGGRRVAAGDRRVLLPLGGETVLVLVEAAPEGLGLAASRELVGQPHRDDHRHADALTGAIGPIHVLACPAGVSASQVRSLMGASELVLVTTTSGLWAADTVSRGQILVLRDCGDATSARIQLDAALSWLAQSGETANLLARARRRSEIVQAMAASDQ